MRKLLNKNTNYLLVILSGIFLVCSVLFFFLLRMQINHLQKEQLFLKQRNVLNKINERNSISAYSIKREFDIQLINTPFPHEVNIIGDTVMENPTNEESEFGHYKKLTTYIQKNNKTYRLTTYVSLEEISHLFIAVFAIQGLIYLVLFLTILIANRKLSILLWKPFYQTLSRLKLYDIHKGDGISLNVNTDISEFNELNQVASQLVSRDQQAYQSQKQFVENASHEIQTPLAIIRSKVELLMEQPDIEEKTAELVSEIAEANDRLSRLNNTLLLLSKIDNNQFIEQSDIALSMLVEQLLSRWKDQYLNNFPALRKNIQPDIHIVANQTLIEILLNNLIKNAVVHNIPNGYINIKLLADQLIIENTGPDLDISPELLFERFRKGNDQVKRSYGLGLALVKHICDMYHYRVSYTYDNRIHKLEVSFT